MKCSSQSSAGFLNVADEAKLAIGDDDKLRNLQTLKMMCKCSAHKREEEIIGFKNLSA